MALLKILVVTALAPSHDYVRFERMGESLLRRLSAYIRGGVLDVVVVHAITRRRLRRLLSRHRPEILHIACHGEGSPRVLAFEDRHGRKETLSAAQLREDIAASGSRPELVVLEACRSLPIADELIDEGGEGGALPRAIGMTDDVTPEHGVQLFEGLYHMLASGLSLEAALDEARQDLENVAPGAVDNAVLRLGPGVGGPSFGLNNALVSRGIAADDLVERVFIAQGLRPVERFVGRRQEVDALVEVFERRRAARLLHVRGAAGVGKSTLLAEALAQAGERGWRGSSRVFAFSFEAATWWRGSERLSAFFDEALEFFGEHSAPRAGDRSDALWAQGRRLGRLVRRETALIVLDDVPTLPRSAGDDAVRRLEDFMHPALAVFLREASRAGECLCVFSTRGDAESVTLDSSLCAASWAPSLDVPGLSASDGAALLRRSGLIDTSEALTELAGRLGGHPLSLELLARRFGSAREALEFVGEGAVGLAQLVARLAREVDAQELLATLRWWGPPEDGPEGARQGVGVAALELQQRAVRAGLVSLNEESGPDEQGTRERGAVLLRHGALVDGAPARSSACGQSFGGDVAQVVEAPRDLAEMVALGRAIDRLRRRGAWSEAGRMFAQRLAQRRPGSQAPCFVAEELAVVAGFFAVDVSGRVDWTSLREEVDDEVRGALLLRAGLSLRSLGQLAQARASLAEAAAAFASQRSWERAATTAIERAVVGLWPVVVDGAEERVASAMSLAERARRPEHLARARALHGVMRARAGAWGQAQRDFAAAREGLHACSGAAALSGLVGFLVWTAELDRAEGDAESPLATLEALAGRLEEAKELHGRSTAPAFAAGLDALARGRLARLYASSRGSMPCRLDALRGWSDPRVVGRVELARAITVFGATQQRWLLPAAYGERARLREEALEDAAGAERDRQRADLLVRS